MPRANRCHIPSQVWHITHRCHKQQFLLKFKKDRRSWLGWLYQARRRFGLCVLNYVVTSNHIHLLVQDQGRGEIARGLQLVAGRTAQQFNRRKSRNGAFWEDRYHATAVQTGTHLARCLVYIDLNMVRAGVVSHPLEWEQGGYREVQAPPDRYGLIDIPQLMRLTGFGDLAQLQNARREWVAAALENGDRQREPAWSEAVAVGDSGYLEGVQQALGLQQRHRQVQQENGLYMLREERESYWHHFVPENWALRPKESLIQG